MHLQSSNYQMAQFGLANGSSQSALINQYMKQEQRSQNQNQRQPGPQAQHSNQTQQMHPQYQQHQAQQMQQQHPQFAHPGQGININQQQHSPYVMQSLQDNQMLREAAQQQQIMRSSTQSIQFQSPHQNSQFQYSNQKPMMLQTPQAQQQVPFRGNGFQQQIPQRQMSSENALSTSQQFQNSTMSYQPMSQSKNSDDNFKVVVRVRPPLARELSQNVAFRSILQFHPENNNSVSIQEYLGAEINEAERQRDISDNPHVTIWHNYTFDYVYGPDASQQYVYENTARPAVMSTLEGYNATILAYGQTGTGKTHTMEGFKYNAGDPQRGIVPRSMEEIFKYIEQSSNRKTTFMVRASYLQIYNENISDLLKTDRTQLSIREDKKKGVFVEGLSEWAVRSPNEIYSLMQQGATSRATATTMMNHVSSRSHAVFIIIVEQSTSVDGGDDFKQCLVGKLNLVDLAGSERVRVTGATGKRLEESKKINQSLSALGNVIKKLTDKTSTGHIPYRDSKLTRLLEDSLGGNCKTTMMAMVSPAAETFGESLCTLKFATRAKKIKNNATVNEDVDQRALLRKYEVELQKLKQELEHKAHQIGTNEQMMQLEEQKQRAEEEREMAISALEDRSREIMIEKEEKKKLEEKIKFMNSKMLIGGQIIEETPQFRNALEQKQKQIRQEYESKLQELEKERQQIEEDKSQVDRYKQLLIKQRDIMIALTARLNERDETIIQLQEELDAYDRIHRETESTMERKNDRVQQLCEFIQENNLQVPQERSHPNLDEEFSQFGAAKDRSLLLGGMTGNQRKYPPFKAENLGEEAQAQMQLMTAEEKIDELMNIVCDQEQQLVQVESGDQAEFMRDKINELVNREVQEKLNRIQNSDSNVEMLSNRVNELEQELDEARYHLEKGENSDEHLKNQLDLLAKERSRVMYFFSNDLLSKFNNINSLENMNYLIGDLSEQNDVNPSISPILSNVNEMIQSAAEFYQYMSQGQLQHNGQQQQRPPLPTQSQQSSFVGSSPKNSNNAAQPFRNTSNLPLQRTPQQPNNQKPLQGGVGSNQVQQPGQILPKGYERRLPPNVEEMLSQRRQELAKSCV